MGIKINESENIIEIKIKECNEPVYAFLCSYFANKTGVALVSTFDEYDAYYGLMSDFMTEMKALCNNLVDDVTILFYREMV